MPALTQLQSDRAAHSFFLLRPPDLAHATFSDSFEQVILPITTPVLIQTSPKESKNGEVDKKSELR
jgi:hypothetical protein